jgi:succinyl-CoA synthetase alpha subunit
MSILVHSEKRVMIQGITGGYGATHARLSLAYGTRIVAGVTPGKGGLFFDNHIPIFDTVEEAARETGATVTGVFVPPPLAADAIIEALAAGLALVVCITEGIPVRDMIKVKRVMHGSSTRLLGPNCPGITTPGNGLNSLGGCRIGIIPSQLHKKGSIGVVSRSGTLTYEAVSQLTASGLGQSTCAGIGGDPVHGLSHIDIVKMLNHDPDTHGIIMIGEIGGSSEEDAAAWIKDNCKKPVAGFVAGATAPPGRRMGHAGAIINGGTGTAAAKIAAMQRAGIAMAPTPSVIAETLIQRMREMGVL